ncbi:MAG: hypothetical protein K6U14_05265 [Firmicutes bacterium]|nr:hypothetical protein [Alicyclobacillaceae bacterium]MCL6497028.1 hypothetical protein [Bacillota bacterium]
MSHPHPRRRTLWAALLAVLLAVITVAAWVRAANLPAYDQTPERTRVVTGATAGVAQQYYSDIPVYLEIPPGTQSISTPTVVGSTIYQYTFSAGGTGYLSALALPALTAQQVAQLAGSKGYVTLPAQYPGGVSPIQFPAGFNSQGLNLAGGQSSLSTGPTEGCAATGDCLGYQAIGVGKYLYTWPANAYPTNGSPGSGYPITGNPGNQNWQVDTSPLITPPVTVQGLDANGQPTSWTSPVAVVGSWDGGVVAVPTFIPPGDTPNPIPYFTNQTQPNGIHVQSYPNSTAAVTSDPTWIGAVPGVGQNCVAFGLSGGAHPRIVILDVTTGAYTNWGVGQIAAGIADTTVYDAATQTLFAQDLYGALYAFDLQGQLVGSFTRANDGNTGWVTAQTEVAKEMVLDGNALVAVGCGGGCLGIFLDQPPLGSPVVEPLASLGYGTLDSPAALNDPSGAAVLVLTGETSGQTRVSVLTPNGTPFVGGGLTNNPSAGPATTYWAATTPTDTNGYVGFVPDAGPNHDLIGWTNHDPNGKPAVVLFVPAPYTLSATVQPQPPSQGPATAITVPSGTPVTIRAYPLPRGVTQGSDDGPDGPNPNASPTTYPPVEFQVGGNAVWQPMQPDTGAGPEVWSATWQPPPNDGLAPVTYQITVAGWPNNDFKATPEATATVTVTVKPAPPPSQENPSGQGTLALQCGWDGPQPGQNGSGPVQWIPNAVPHSCTLDAAPPGEPASWFVQHPQVGAKFGDVVAITLTVPTPPVPAGWRIANAVLDAKVPYTEGVPNMPTPAGDAPDGQNLYDPNAGPVLWQEPTQVHLLQTSGQDGSGPITAAGWLVVSWTGYPPDLAAANIGDTTMLTADWTLTVTWQKWVPNEGWVTKPKPTVTEGTASAPITVNGTDYYEVATPFGY